jgi:hypothetical protein
MAVGPPSDQGFAQIFPRFKKSNLHFAKKLLGRNWCTCNLQWDKALVAKVKEGKLSLIRKLLNQFFADNEYGMGFAFTIVH